ncbi:hypothetical protein D3C81_1704450 [compost metagenome]
MIVELTHILNFPYESLDVVGTDIFVFCRESRWTVMQTGNMVSIPFKHRVEYCRFVHLCFVWFIIFGIAEIGCTVFDICLYLFKIRQNRFTVHMSDCLVQKDKYRCHVGLCEVERSQCLGIALFE